MRYNLQIPELPDFDFWRQYARQGLSDRIEPQNLIWGDNKGDQTDNLFGDDYNHLVLNGLNHKTFNIPKDFIAMAQIAILYKDKVQSHNLLYRMIWRIVYKNKNLMKMTTDDDVLALIKMVKAVRRDAYKITAFLRFREIQDEEGEHFIAWYETEHYSLPLKLDFFTSRFRNMRWTIMTPYMAAIWNKRYVSITHEVDRKSYPNHDEVEDYWVTYYGSTTNPARIKKKAMMTQMPKKYWKNMPETRIISDLIREAPDRVKEMLQ
jgi:DNA polymerase